MANIHPTSVDRLRHARSISSRIWFILSVWPSVWGWYAELRIRWVPRLVCNCSQKRATNWVPRSEMMVFGTPCKHSMRSTYNSAYFLAGYTVLTGRKCADLVSLSTTTQMESYPFWVWGNPTMKSMLISSHFHSGMFKGWRVPAGLRWLALTLRQISHSDTYLAISLFILVHQNCCLRSWYILLLPGWIDSREEWASSRICFLSSKSFGTTSRVLNHNTFSLYWWKQPTLGSPSDILLWISFTPLSCFCAAMTRSQRVGVSSSWANVPCGTMLLPQYGDSTESCTF